MTDTRHAWSAGFRYHSQIRQAMVIFEASLRGVRTPTRLGRVTLGGVTHLFSPVSADATIAEEFRRAHTQGMRAEVLRSVQHALRIWGRLDGTAQEDFDALFVALAQLARFLQAHPADPAIQRVLDECLMLQDDMSSAWLRQQPTWQE
ncbi:hypothetical protein [Actinocrispum sp. NPDC049592]|uniref:hypothetical protein n=1 Tax=Actinocrispum sp. NPDC049592 TaxID=3154835 RepID=UPI00342745CE